MQTKNVNGVEIVVSGKERYIELQQAQPSSRLLAGSSDEGYDAEYVGYGTVDGTPVRAVYLVDFPPCDCDVAGGHGHSCDVEDYIDWENALECGRVEIIK